MIQTEPDYGEPQFKVSRERIGDWSVIIQTETYDDWLWTATRSDGSVSYMLTYKLSQGKGLKSYEDAKAHCTAMLESLTPNGFTPQRYLSTEDASNNITRLENGRWVCVRNSTVGKHDFATASLAAAAHEVEDYGGAE